MERVYLASRYSRIRELRAYAVRLQDLGIETTSRWIFRTEPNVEDLESDEAERVAIEDLEDVARADACILFAETPRTPTRAGRMVEFGYAIATKKRLICLGGKENVFTSLPQIEHFDSFRDLDAYLSLRRPKLAA
jgi:nucleoside 2-deoxyribosyltransferase